MEMSKILASMAQVGADLPAYAELLEQVIAAVGESDQVALKAAYADARARSDAAHRDAQAI